MNITRRGSAFDLPNVAHSPGATQSSSIILPGTVLQKEMISAVIRSPGDEEITILSISQPCTAVDVFVDMTNLPLRKNGLFAVRVYSIMGNVRTIVGRGRLNISDGTGGTQLSRLFERARLVASTRQASARCEITMRNERTSGADFTDPGLDVEFPVAAIGYQASGLPLATPLHFHKTSGSTSVGAHTTGLELLSANGENTEAAGTAARFIQIWDVAAGGALVAGPTAMIVDEVLVPPQTSWSIEYEPDPMVMQFGLVIASSSTAGINTPAGTIGAVSWESR